jgi:hypothetical protein
MMLRNMGLTVALTVGCLAAGTLAQAQDRVGGGAAAGAATGAVTGGIVGGPVGAAVGGVVGAATGAAAGGIAEGERSRFRTYAVGRRHSSYRWSEPVRVGTVLPADGVEYYDVPSDYGVSEYRYTIVNDEPVIVEPRTRRIIQVIE